MEAQAKGMDAQGNQNNVRFDKFRDQIDEMQIRNEMGAKADEMDAKAPKWTLKLIK